jgi:predicted transcriptional regulator
MRITINIDDELLRKAKDVAAKTNRSMGEVVSDALREVFARQKASGRTVRLPVSRQRSGLCPGVNLDDSASLLDLMEQEP